MKDLKFEYTDSKFTLILLGLSLLSFVLLLIVEREVIELLGVIGALILTLGVPLLIFFLNKKKIKKQGTAMIHDSFSVFRLSGSTVQVDYADIKAYQVERYNGTQLKIKFMNGKNLKVEANSNFCNSSQFEAFCQEFERTIQEFKSINNVEIVRKKSMFEKAWMLPLLVVLNVGILGTFIHAHINGVKVPRILYTSAAILIPVWGAYYKAKKRKSKQVT